MESDRGKSGWTRFWTGEMFPDTDPVDQGGASSSHKEQRIGTSTDEVVGADELRPTPAQVAPNPSSKPIKPTDPPEDRATGWKEDPAEPGLYWYWTGSRYLQRNLRGHPSQTGQPTKPPATPRQPAESKDEPKDNSIVWGLVWLGLFITLVGISSLSQVDWSAIFSRDSQQVQREVEEGSGLMWLIAPVIFLVGVFLTGVGLLAPFILREESSEAADSDPGSH
jgi:hypothetical protein